MSRELFGLILSVYVYPDSEFEKTLHTLDSASQYGLTGNIFALDPYTSKTAQNILNHAAGMPYINRKCTGSILTQQVFGGSHGPRTDDKTGTMAHLQRLTSARSINEDFDLLENVQYAYNEV